MLNDKLQTVNIDCCIKKSLTPKKKYIYIGMWLGQQYPATKKAAGHAELVRAAQTAPYDPLQPT